MPTATAADIELLRRPGSLGLFKHVYADAGGGPHHRPVRHRVRFKFRDDGGRVRQVRCGRFKTPEAAARAAIGWLAARYGSDWPAFVGRLDPRLSVAGDGWRLAPDRGAWWAEVAGTRSGPFPTRAAAWGHVRAVRGAAA